MGFDRPGGDAGSLPGSREPPTAACRRRPEPDRPHPSKQVARRKQQRPKGAGISAFRARILCGTGATAEPWSGRRRCCQIGSGPIEAGVAAVMVWRGLKSMANGLANR